MFHIGIIGTGRIGFLLENDPLRIKPCTHAGGIIKNKKLTLTCACDINKKRLSAFQKKYNVSRLYTDYIKMLNNEKLDAVVISTWTDAHKDITLQAAQAGIKVIICEKPMAFNSKDCLTMIHTCKKYHAKLIINHERRYDPLYKKTKELVHKKKIGDVRTVIANVLTSASFKKKSFQIDKSSLLHDGTHLIDIAFYLFGEPRTIKGFIPSYQKDTVYGTIEFKNRVILFLEAGGNRKYFNFELDIQGTKGRIKIGNEYKEIWLCKKSQRYSHFFELAPVKFPKIPDKNHFIEEYKEVTGLLEGKITNPASSGEDGLKVIETIERLTK